MKKFLFILCIFSSVANAEISCEDAGGLLFKGNDGKTEYCVSYHGMNWWSANAWCQSLGWELVDLETECKKRGMFIVSACPQFAVRIMAIRVWTKNTLSPSEALAIEIRDGILYRGTKTSSYPALCLVK
ncbi:MAG: hypothetical protein ACI4RJ_05915 [Alphaproteobacteria bacterium]